jgi:hypothetical protein
MPPRVVELPAQRLIHAMLVWGKSMIPVGDRGRELLKPPSTGLHFDSRYIMPYSENARANRLYMGEDVALRFMKQAKGQEEELAAQVDTWDDDDGEIRVRRRWFGMINLPTRTRIKRSELRRVGTYNVTYGTWLTSFERAGRKHRGKKAGETGEKHGGEAKRLEAELAAKEVMGYSDTLLRAPTCCVIFLLSRSRIFVSFLSSVQFHFHLMH